MSLTRVTVTYTCHAHQGVTRDHVSYTFHEGVSEQAALRPLWYIGVSARVRGTSGAWHELLVGELLERRPRCTDFSYNMYEATLSVAYKYKVSSRESE